METQEQEETEYTIDGWIEICLRKCPDHVVLSTRLGTVNVHRSGEVVINGTKLDITLGLGIFRVNEGIKIDGIKYRLVKGED